MDQGSWKNRFQDLMQTAQIELKKTTKIGMKMLSASQANSLLHEKYEKLGLLTLDALEDKTLTWEDESVNDIVKSIKELRKDLESFEADVHNIKEMED